MTNTYAMLVMGRAAARVGEEKEARLYLEGMLRANPPMEEKIEAWYWLAKISKDPAEKRDYLENILANNLGDARARRELAILNGELNQDEIIDPDRLKKTHPVEPKSGSADRFTCPTCGGRMTYTPDGQSLTCEYCEARQRLKGGVQGVDAVQEGNFVAALSTARGHVRPMTVYELICQGCSASFITQPEQISITCPYCASTYVVRQDNTREINTPDGLIPFRVSESQAKTALLEWFEGSRPRVARGLALYLPVWTFDVTGQIRWEYKVYRNKQWVSQTDMAVIDVNDLLVAGTRRLPALLQESLSAFSLREVVPYDARYLASWLAETYEIALGDASLQAREAALQRERQKILTILPQEIQDFRLDTSQMMVSAFRLLLFPVWLTHYVVDDQRYNVLINGQNAAVFGEKPQSGMRKWLNKLME